MSEKEITNEKIEIHYYFDDGSHKMDAFIRNKAEKDLLDALYRIGLLYELNVKVESEAYSEGGLVELLDTSYILATAISVYFKPTINDTLTYYFTRDKELENLQKKKISLEISNLELDKTRKEIEIKLLEDKQVSRSISNFYKKVDSYNKIKKVGFKNLSKETNEYIVEKKEFKKFILIDETDILEDDNAIVEIISPILKEGKDRWKGIYNGEKIQFSMGDTSFKEDVINAKQTFANGSIILCKLKTTITQDALGEEKRKSYSVKEVYGKQETPKDEIKLRTSGLKKKRRDWESRHQSTMFDFINEEE